MLGKTSDEAQHGNLRDEGEIQDKDEPSKRASLPGVEFDLRKFPFRTTPLPIFLEMVLIRACPLLTRFFSICCIFFDLDVSLSMESDRLREPFTGLVGVSSGIFSVSLWSVEKLRVVSSGVAGEIVIGIEVGGISGSSSSGTAGAGCCGWDGSLEPLSWEDRDTESTSSEGDLRLFIPAGCLPLSDVVASETISDIEGNDELKTHR